MFIEDPIVIQTKSGVVALANTHFPFYVGGTRLIKDVTENEVKDLAYSMQLKLSSYNLPIGGAKCGVKGKQNNLEDLSTFLREIKDLLNGITVNELNKKYNCTIDNSQINNNSIQLITGPDIGVSEDLYHDALRKEGMGKLARKGLLSQIHPTYNLPLDNLATGLGIVTAAEEIFRLYTIGSKSEDPLLSKSYLLEGFGKVSTGIAVLLNQRCNLVAFSNIYGTVKYNPDNKFCNKKGFIINELLVLQGKYGDEFIKELELPILTHGDLFETHADFLVPGARTRVIDSKIADFIINSGTKIIVPAANYPYTPEGVDVLEKSGVICFPDFISNAGAVIGAMIEFSGRYSGEEEVTKLFDLIYQAVSLETRDLLIEGKACGCNLGRTFNSHAKSLYQLAVDRAIKKKRDLMELEEKSKDIKYIAETILNYYLI